MHMLTLQMFVLQPSIDRLVRLLGCRVVARYSPAVTHVLVNTGGVAFILCIHYVYLSNSNCI